MSSSTSGIRTRAADVLRPVQVEYGVQPHAAGSTLIRMGETRVLCAVSVENRLPSFLEGQERGWVTAEYGMLPCSTHSRYRREAVSGRSGRTYEIQRLIGRSLRMMVDPAAIAGLTFRIDCDVITADGGTRCASITGAALALRSALQTLVSDGRLEVMPRLLPVAAVSAGIVDDQVVLDLEYGEDSRAEVDANFVFAESRRLIEVQATAEGRPCTLAELHALTELAAQGTERLLTLWQPDVKHL
ncbi:MAG: ribonuclease PH [Desulfobulbus propionicus]|nr:MAG: ribonuclease PH [Desulfobulbus propionicus]